MQFRPKFLLAGALMGSLVLAAACSGNDDDPTPTTSPSTSPTSQSTAAPTSPSETATTPAGSTTSPTTGASTTPASTTTPAASTTPSGPTVCATGDLDVGLVNGGGAAGTHFQVINVTNTGDSNCLIEGLPGRLAGR